jgi:hypothetical protein
MGKQKRSRRRTFVLIRSGSKAKHCVRLTALREVLGQRGHVMALGHVLPQQLVGTSCNI